MLNNFQRMMMGLPGNPFGLQDDENTPSPPASGGGAGATADSSVLPAVAAPLLERDSQTALFDKMGQMGALLLASGQRMTPQMRGQILSQGANVMGGTGQSMLNSAQARLMNAKAQEAQIDAERRDEFRRKIAADPSILQKLNVTQDQYNLMGMDAVTKALEAQMSRDPSDVAYKNAMVKKLQEGNIHDWQQVGEDEFGNKQYGIPSQLMQQRGGQVQLPGAQGGGVNGPGVGIFDQLQGLTGQAALKKINDINPGIGATVEGLVKGDIPYTASLIKSKRGEIIDALARVVDPSFSAGTYAQRQATIKDFNKNGGANTAGGQEAFGNVGIKHMGEIYDLAEKLPDHTNWGPLNTTVNALDIQRQQRSANGGDIGSYKLSVMNGFDEIAKALGIGTGEGQAKLQAALDAAQGPTAVRQVVRQQAKLLKDKLDTLQQRWNTEMGPAAGNRRVVSPEAEQVLNRILADEPKKGSVNYDKQGNRQP